METRLQTLLTAAVLIGALGTPLAAQQGTIVGRVTDASTLDPVPMATIRVVGGGEAGEVTSESDGSFELHLPAGAYDLLVEAADFAPARFYRVRVRAGLTTTKNLPLESEGYRLAGFIVTASRGTVDTEITAPSSSHSVSGAEIAERPAPSPVEHLKETPGVDIGMHGIQASNVVVRGFNNIFSGALHMLTDYRLAGLPALRANFLHFLPLNDTDIERMEVVLGPGAALYGPNTAFGVMHVITKSPFESPGTSVSLGAGERSTLQASFRSAVPVSDKFAVKLSGQFFRGREWPHVDSTELAAKIEAETYPERCSTDRQQRGLPPEEAQIACGRIGERDPQLQRMSLEVRTDWRYSRRGTLVTTYGITDATGIELTGLGATQIKNWIHHFAQARFTYNRWNIQGYLNLNDSGEAFQLRDGVALVDQSTLGVVQVKNGFSIADGKQDFTYGWDYFSTDPQTQGTIYGDYEDDNDIQEWGVYLQSRTSLSPTVDLIAVGRIDAHSILPSSVFSPRVALIVKPDDESAVRLSYNRAFSTPSSLNYFLDLGAGFADELGLLGYTSRGFGSGRNGFAWQHPDGTLVGMRSPFNPDGAGELLSVIDPDALWQLGLVAADRQAPFASDVLAVLRSLTPGAADVDVLYQDINRPDEKLPLSTLDLPDVPPIEEGITETFEAGWSGVMGGALRVSVDAYYMKRRGFVSPLVVESPLLYLDPDGITGWLGSAYVPARTEDLMARLGLSREVATAQATAEAGALVPALAAGFDQIPLAVASPDVPEMAGGGADLIATYRNVGDLSFWGGDVALQLILSRRWTIRATYSHVSKNWFTIEGSEPLALNAPANKGTIGMAFRDEALGLNASARLRYTAGFPFQSTDFAGTGCVPDIRDPEGDCIEGHAVVDVTFGYRIANSGATLQLGVSNLLNQPYRSFVGVPEIGRLAMARIRYDFF